MSPDSSVPRPFRSRLGGPLGLTAAVAAVLAALALLVVVPATAQSTPPPAERSVVPVEDETDQITVEMKRAALPGEEDGADHPYSISIPVGWQVRRDIPAPGVFLGPADLALEQYPGMLLVRVSDVDLSDPETILGNLQKNAEAGDWTLVEGEVRDFGGAQGLWIVRRLPAQEGYGERVNMAVKLPLDGGRSLDVTATLPADQWNHVVGLQAQYMLRSLQPTKPEPSDETAEGDGTGRS
jgi:hypothetical protein